jgi:hypothetical protein
MDALTMIGMSLFRAAVEGMGNTPTNAKATQPSEHLILRFANVEYHREVIVSCESKLLMKEACHASPIESGNKKVQSNLANASEARIVLDSQELSLQKVEGVVS